MAIASIHKSNIMTNLTAAPLVRNKIQDSGGRVYGKRCTFLTDAAWDTTDAVPLCRLKATDQVRSIRWNNDLADAGMADVDCGLYAANDWSSVSVAFAALIDLDTFFNSLDMKDAAALFAECLGSGLTTTGDLVSKPLWQAAGVSAAPPVGTEYDVALTINDSVDAASNYTILIDYMAGS